MRITFTVKVCLDATPAEAAELVQELVDFGDDQIGDVEDMITRAEALAERMSATARRARGESESDEDDDESAGQPKDE